MTTEYIRLIERLLKALRNRDAEKMLDVYSDSRVALYYGEISVDEAEYIKKIISRKLVLL